MPKKKTALTIEERLQQALVSAEEQPYEVPENWVWVRLGSLADVKGGKRLPKGTTFSENITKHPYIRVTDFNAIGVSLEGLKYIDEDVYEKISRYTISSDDIYVSIAGSIGKVGIIPSCIDGANLTENAAKITNIKGINQKYLCLFLKSEFAQYQMQSATIATTQAKLALFRIESLTFPLPPLSEQQRIVERIEELFAKLDEAKERLQEVADSFAVRKAAILHKAFTGELTQQWRCENGVSDESWEEKKFSEVAVIKSNLVSPFDYLDYPHIAPDSIEKFTGRLLSYRTIREDNVKSPKHLFYKGQILYSKIRPYLSKAIIADVDGLCSADMYPIEALCNTKYLLKYMLSTEFLEQSTTAGSRSLLPKINQKELSSILYC